MKIKKTTLITLFLVGFGISGLKAQEAIPSTGGNASGSGGSVGYSVGQVVYTTNTGANGSVAQGVQQPFDISIVTETAEAKGITLQCSVYPNPATDFVNLEVKNFKTEDLTYQLLDMTGKLLAKRKVSSPETSIDIRNLVTATYFLKVIQSNKELKTFKIIKH